MKWLKIYPKCYKRKFPATLKKVTKNLATKNERSLVIWVYSDGGPTELIAVVSDATAFHIFFFISISTLFFQDDKEKSGRIKSGSEIKLCAIGAQKKYAMQVKYGRVWSGPRGSTAFSPTPWSWEVEGLKLAGYFSTQLFSSLLHSGFQRFTYPILRWKTIKNGHQAVLPRAKRLGLLNV